MSHLIVYNTLEKNSVFWQICFFSFSYKSLLRSLIFPFVRLFVRPSAIIGPDFHVEFWGWFWNRIFKPSFWEGLFGLAFRIWVLGWDFEPNLRTGYLFSKIQKIYKHRALAYTYLHMSCYYKKNCYENASLIFCRFVHMCSKIYENTCQSGLRKNSTIFRI